MLGNPVQWPICGTRQNAHTTCFKWWSKLIRVSSGLVPQVLSDFIVESRGIVPRSIKSGRNNIEQVVAPLGPTCPALVALLDALLRLTS